MIIRRAHIILMVLISALIVTPALMGKNFFTDDSYYWPKDTIEIIGSGDVEGVAQVSPSYGRTKQFVFVDDSVSRKDTIRMIIKK